MKTIRLSVVSFLLISAMACTKKNDTPTNSDSISNSDAADMVAASLSANSNGVASVADDATNVGTSMSIGSIGTAPHSSFAPLNATTVYAPSPVNTKGALSCGTVITDTIKRQGGQGSAIAYSYNLDYSFTLNCNNSIPSDLTNMLTFNGTYSGPFWSLTDAGTSTFTITGLPAQTTSFVVNGQYQRNGTFQSKIDTAKHGTRSVNVVITALTLLKPARTITGGTATITVTGTTPKGGNFNYTGTVTFNNDGTANLTLDGTAYNINLATGVKLKKG